MAARDHSSRAELEQRDQKLAKLESCAGLEGGLVRLTRAMLWIACADTLAVDTPSAQLTVALRGYALAAKLSRLSFAPSSSAQPAVTSNTQAIASARSWFESQATILRRANEAISTLPAGSHGRAVAELALGQAWHRLLHTRLDLPALSPSERASVKEPLQQALAPYVVEAQPLEARAAHAGGLVSEWRLLRAFQAAQPGATAEALRALVLPALPPFTVSTSDDVDTRIAAEAPSYIASRLLPLEHVAGRTLRALLRQGFDPKFRRALAGRDLAEADLLLIAHARSVLAARTLIPEQASLAADVLRGARGEDAAALASIAAAITAALSSPPSTNARPLATRPSPHLAVLTYDAWRLATAELTPPTNLDRLEAQARELTRPVPALAACMPAGFLAQDGCTCPSIRTLY